MKEGLLLINLGTPDAPTPPAVRRYLKEFLMDPLVIDIPSWLRWLLVHAVILPKRPYNSAQAYEKIWTEAGSPLGVYTQALGKRVQTLLEKTHLVQTAMRYGNPSIPKAVKHFAKEGVKRIHVLPLYPQYSLAATESSKQFTKFAFRKYYPEADFSFVEPFYNHPEYLKAVTEVSRSTIQNQDYDHVLFSFHGIPERQVRKTDASGSFCFASNCCEQVGTQNRLCYRAHCVSTARALAQRLEIPSSKYTICFQSRLGRTPWIRPFTDEVLTELPKKGVKRLIVFCPSFVADCLETLEEIEMRGRESFVEAGGQSLHLVPSLNASEAWAKAIPAMIPH